MKIVQVAPWTFSIPPLKYGGIELVIHNLTEELVRMGHEVYLLAPGDSKTSATLVPCSSRSLSLYKKDKRIPFKQWSEFYHAKYISKVIDSINKIKPDVVHNHLGWLLLSFKDLIEAPIITTEHWSTTGEMHRFINSYHKESAFVSISKNQQTKGEGVNWAGSVYNGIDLDQYTFSNNKGDYFAFLGRIHKSKGIKEICELIKTTNYKLKIGAYIAPKEKNYFKKEIEPLIDGEQIEYLGELNHTQKVDLLKNAKALLSWLTWDEPFGLVVIEANACGTPVIVNRKGAMPEIIRDGFNGYLVDSLDEMKVYMSKLNSIEPESCRKIIEEKFSDKKMTQGYLKIYSDTLLFSNDKVTDSKPV
jgi:glycosyltransferase involved in cell wall biosynthesis